MPKVILIIIRYLQRFPWNFKHKPILSFYSFAIVARNIFGCFFCGTMRALCCQLWQLFGSQDTALNADQSNQAKHWGNDGNDDDDEENNDEDKDNNMFFIRAGSDHCLPWHSCCWYSIDATLAETELLTSLPMLDSAINILCSRCTQLFK